MKFEKDHWGGKLFQVDHAVFRASLCALQSLSPAAQAHSRRKRHEAIGGCSTTALTALFTQEAEPAAASKALDGSFSGLTAARLASKLL